MKFEFLDKYENDDFEIIFSLEYIHSFSGSIDLVFAYIENQEEEKEYIIFYKRIFRNAKKIKLTNNEAQRIVNIIENTRISINLPENFGLDGYSCIITFFNNDNFSTYKK